MQMRERDIKIEQEEWEDYMGGVSWRYRRFDGK